MKLLDPHHPMFDRPVARFLTTVLPILWSGLEFLVFDAPVWGLVFLAAGIYAGYMLYIVRPNEARPGEAGDKDRDP